MLLSITTDTDSCSLEVSDDLELENFKALCEAEVNIPSISMAVFVNGAPLIDDKKTLAELGVKDGDLVMIVRDGSRSRSISRQPASGIPPEVAQFDFSGIQVPSNNRSTLSTPHTSQGSSSGQHRAADPQQLAGLSAPEESSDSSRQQQQQTSPLEDRDDPAVILDLLKTSPEEFGRLKQLNPALAEAANKGLDEFTKVMKAQREAKVEKERQRIRMLTADPFDAEAQKMIASEIQKENIDENMEAAMEYHPESFGTVQMLYINCCVNGYPVKAFIDSGAQTTIMSEACAKRCNIMRLVDQRWSGIAKGVGTQRIIGRVHMVQLEFAGVFLASSFSILQEQPMDMLLGLDMLKRHQMCIDLGKNMLHIGTTNTSTPFLSESELPECARLTQATEVKAIDESQKEARRSEDEALAKALAESAKDSPQPSGAGTSGGLGATPSDADIAEIMALGFSQEEALRELRSNNFNKTIAIASLLAKKFAAP